MPLYDIPLNTPCGWTSGKRSCHHTMDPYGEHAWECVGANKAPFKFHHAMVHAIGYLLHKAARYQPPDGLFTKSDHILQEPTGLLQPDLPSHLRPADIAIYCPQQGRLHSPPRVVAINITITKFPFQLEQHEASSLSTNYYHPNCSGAQWSAWKYKPFPANHPKTFFKALRDRDILFLPASIDPLGGFGPLIHHLLFGPSNLPSPPWVPPFLPHPCHPRSHAHDYGAILTSTVTLAPFHTPRFCRWALKLLSLNYTQALGRHLQHFEPALTPLPITAPFHPTLPTFDFISSPTFIYDPGGGLRGVGHPYP
jgi:hypothetical protein